MTAAQMPSHTHNTNNTGAHTHNTNNTGAHTHTMYVKAGGFTTSNRVAKANYSTNYNANDSMSSAGAHSHNTNNAGAHSHSMNNAGSGGAHSHGMDIRVQYVDVIIATKN